MDREPAEPAGHWRHGLGIGLLALATLVLELALTRVLSVALWYHFGFLVISTALLGFGTAGVVLALWRGLREYAALDRALSLLALLFGILTVGCFWLLQRLPFDPFSLLVDRRQLLVMPLYYLLLALPFFCAGLAFALLFTRGVRRITRLYACDLLGAGLGCAVAAGILPLLGGAGAVVFAAACGLLAAAVFAVPHATRLAATAGILALATLLLAVGADRALPIAVTPNKPRPLAPPLLTAWNTVSRIDVYEPSQRGPLGRRLRTVLVDAGTAATSMFDLRPNVRAVLRQLPDDALYDSGIAYVGKAHPTILIIGSGAGQEVLDGLHFGAASITAVEVNPIITDLVTHRMGDFWGGLFTQPEVHLVTDDGRSFVRRSHEHYDAIIAVHTISNAAMAAGALSLAETYVLTREAVEDYVAHLAPDGVLYVTRPEAQIARLVATGREVLATQGVTEPAAHMFVFRYPSEVQQAAGEARRGSFVAGLLMKTSPFTPEEVRAMSAVRGAEVLYSPLAPGADSIYATLLTAPDLRAVYAEHATHLEPATDDRPFFNQQTRWSRIGWATVRDVFTQARMGRMALEDRPVAEVTLLVMLGQSVLIAAVLILLPLARGARVGRRARNRWRFLLYFAGLGFGFILVELALIQRFTLFLGQPTTAFAVILASLLVWTGVGSALVGHLAAPPRRTLGRLLPLILATLVATAYGMPWICARALELALVWRVLLTVALLAPLGMVLGMPMPLGLRIVAAEAAPLVPWAWGVNSFCTVIGTVCAVIGGMLVGFTAVLVLAAGCYALALGGLLVRAKQRTPAVPMA